MLFEQAAGVDEILLRREYLRVGARGLDRRKRAFFHLGFGIGEQLFRERDGLFLHLHVFVERDEIGVEAHHAINGGDELLLEEQAGDAALVGGDADEAVVEAGTETAHQRLREVQAEARTGIGIVIRG